MSNSTDQDLERLVAWAKEHPYEGKNKDKGSPAYIYFITDGVYVKIGVATNLDKRLKGLQTGNPRELKILYSFFTEWPYVVEAKLHKKYKHKHIRCEWFDILDDFPLVRTYYLTPKDIERMLNVNHYIVNKIINSPDFPAIRIGKSIRVLNTDLNEYLHTHVFDYKGRRLILDNKPKSLD